ncbi:MAG: SNF2-related protein [Zavarzinella sp.]
MIREEQIDLRRLRAQAGKFQIENLTNKRLFSDYRITNPESGGTYTVQIRGFDVGDNHCTCPDYRSNTLGTCKHIEAVLNAVAADAPEQVKSRKAAVTRPELILDYTGERLRLKMRLPGRTSDQLTHLLQKYFNEEGYWNGVHRWDEFVDAMEKVPEQITVASDAMDFLDREIELANLRQQESVWLQELAEIGDQATVRQVLNVPLYDYQAHGAIFLACRGRSILGDDMGLGKTVQTLAAIELLARYRGISKVLVVSPASVKYQWPGQIQQFTNRSHIVVDGLKEVRQNLYHAPSFYKLVNYEQILRDFEEISQWEPDVIVLDEAQRIKNWEAKTTQIVKKLKSRFAMVLSGTPLENRLEELYSIVQFVDERRFGPAFQFLEDHRQYDESGNFLGYRKLDQIREKLAPIFLRRTRQEVLGELPERIDTTRTVLLDENQQVHYDQQKSRLAQLLARISPTQIDRKRILTCLKHMRMICDSAHVMDSTITSSPKLEELRALLPDLLESDTTHHKVVLFSEFETMLQLVAGLLQELKISYAMLHGSMNGSKRKEALERFQHPDCRIFLSTDAGGVGLNLQQADTVINLELPWNPAVLAQRIARVHRLGQRQQVRVIHFITQNTIEESVKKAIDQKQELFDELFQGELDEIVMGSSSNARLFEQISQLAEIPTEATVGTTPTTVSELSPGLLLHAVGILETLAAEWQLLPLDGELRQRAETAVQKLFDQLQQ